MLHISPTISKNIQIVRRTLALALVLLTALYGLLFTPTFAFAQDASDDSADPATEEPAETDFNIFEGPNSDTFEALNPLAIAESPFVRQFSSPAGIINRSIQFIFPLVGLLLFLMLVWGGFEMLVSAHNSKGLEKGRQRVTAALVGFFLLFSSFWIIQIIEYIFGLAIL